MQSENVSGHHRPFLTGHAGLSGLLSAEHDDSWGVSGKMAQLGSHCAAVCLSFNYLTRLPVQVHLTHNAHNERNSHYPPNDTSSRCPTSF